MKITIAHVIAKKEDFKICSQCGKVNWHENENCVVCKGAFRKVTDKDIDEMIKEYEEKGQFWLTV